jgi:hypothetical protein
MEFTQKMEETRREVNAKIKSGEVIKPIDQQPGYRQPQLPTLSGTGVRVIGTSHIVSVCVAVAYVAVSWV